MDRFRRVPGGPARRPRALLAHDLFEQTSSGTTADVETWATAREVAQRTVSLSSREAATRFGLAKGGSTQGAVDRMVGDGTLVVDATTRSGWRVVDPLLAAWLRGES